MSLEKKNKTKLMSLESTLAFSSTEVTQLYQYYD